MQWNSGIFSCKSLFWSLVFLCFYWQEVKIKAVGCSLVYTFWSDRKTFIPLGLACNFPEVTKTFVEWVACRGESQIWFLQSTMLDNMLLLQFGGRRCCCEEYSNFLWQIQKHCGFNWRCTCFSFLSDILATCGQTGNDDLTGFSFKKSSDFKLCTLWSAWILILR